MKQLNREQSKEVLESYEPVIHSAFERAIQSMYDHLNIGTCLTKRTRAGIIRDYAVHYLEDELKEDPSVQIIRRKNTVYFRFGESLIARIKKLDKKHLAGYNHTASSRDYTNQQCELFGRNYRLTSVHIGYILDDFGVSIREVVVTCPIQSGKRNEWKFRINKVTQNTVPNTESNHGQTKGYKYTYKARKDQSKNGGTGTGGQGTDTN